MSFISISCSLLEMSLVPTVIFIRGGGGGGID